jgi:type IX secretion system PorP/SprF family membrane protein
MKRYIIGWFFLFLVSDVCAQQIPHFSQYMLNGFLVNPALAGSENYGEVKTGYRNQWAGIEGAPESYYLTVQMPLNKRNLQTTATSIPTRGKTGSKALFQDYNKKEVVLSKPHHGIGFTAITDKAGALKRSDFSLTYAYHLPLTKELKMSAGLSGGVSIYRVNEAGLHLTDPNDPTFIGGNYNRVKPNITASTLLYSKRLFIGSSSTQILQDELSAGYNDQDTHKASTRVHHSLMGGYKIALDPKFSILPSVLIKYASPAPLSVDTNLKVLYKDIVWAGGSYRQNNSVVLLGGINVSNMLQVGYAYDMATPSISKMAGGAHEVVLGLMINNRGKIFSPSDFW